MIDRIWKVSLGTILGVFAIRGIALMFGDIPNHDWSLIALVIFLHLDVMYELRVERSTP